MFEKQPRWSFPQLQKDTHQPTQHLKEVLGEIAVKNLRGPYKDLWELKKGAGRGRVGGVWLGWWQCLLHQRPSHQRAGKVTQPIAESRVPIRARPAEYKAGGAEQQQEQAQ